MSNATNNSIELGQKLPPSIASPNLSTNMDTTMNPLLEYYQKHAGHEEMHMKIALFFLLSIAVSHLAVIYWKTKHFKSYQTVTTIILYGLSLLYTMNSESYLSVINWILFTFSIIWVLFRIKYRLNNRNTPKLIYRFFSTMHTAATFMIVLSVGLYVFLFVIAMLDFGTNSMFVQFIEKMFSIILLNGVLFGVLYQDTAAIITDTLFSRRGIHKHDQLPTQDQYTDLCLICGLDLTDSEEKNSLSDNICTINCGHKFHEDCIRGWCLIGKKDTCPYCFEKCDLRSRLMQPWEKTELYYGDLLLFMRILLAWNPIIVIGVVYITKWIGWE